MRPGQYDAAGHRTVDQQLEDLFPEFDQFGEPYDPVMWERAWAPYETNQFPSVTGGAGAERNVKTRVPASTRQPGGSPPRTPPEEDPRAAQLLDDVHG